MRFRWILFLLMLLVALVCGVMGYIHREPLGRQWTLYRIGAAASPQEAATEIVRCETGPDRNAMIGELVGKWGDGNGQFDLYLAMHIGSGSCSEELRMAFAVELGRRERLLERWARYWTWRAPLPPDRQIASVVAYFNTLASAKPPRSITWREALDMQALFQLTGQGSLAEDLTPKNWRDRYTQWQRVRPATIPHIARSEEPFPES